MAGSESYSHFEQEETKVCFFGIKPSLHKYSKKLESLTTVFIDAYYSVFFDKKI